MSQVYTYPAAGGGGGGAGDASAANQLLQLSQETTTATQTAAINTKTPALGQALAAASVPVVLTAAQLATLTPPAAYTGGLTDTQLRASAVPVTGGLTDTQLRASAVPVSGSVTANAGTNLNTSALALDATLVAVSAKLPATLGQKTSANSMAVTLASDQSALLVTSAVTDTIASGTITTQNLVPGGTATAGSAVASGALGGASTSLAQITGTYTGALSLQFTVDGTNWITAGGVPLMNVNTGVLSATIPSATQGIFQFNVAGSNQYRVTALGAATGTATVTLRSSRATSMVALDASLPVGANIIGALTANQSVNNAQVAGVALLTGNGVTGTGSQRVTIASDNTPIFTKAGGKTSANAPARLDYTATSVTTAAFVQLVASTTTASTEIEIFDSSGQTLAIATGAAASEVIQAYIFPGGNGRIPLAIAAATRVSIKAISGTASVGEIDINFYN